MTSPELALVDPSLADELRAALPDRPSLASRPQVDRPIVWPPATPRDPIADADETRSSSALDLIVLVPDDGVATNPSTSDHFDAAVETETSSAVDLIVGYEVEGDTSESVSDTSGHPRLPAPEPGFDPTDETNAVLLRIQERLSHEPERRGRRRRIRRRFTIASGLVAVTALSVFAAELYVGLAPMPGA